MSGSRVFADQLDELGIWWPEGDGDALRESAAAWTQAADVLEDIGHVLDVTASMVAENHRGHASARFTALWARWRGDAGYIAMTVADCRRLAAALTEFSTDVDVADRALVQLIEQAMEMNAATNPLALVAMFDELWRSWLSDSADSISTELAARIAVAASALAWIGDIGAVASPTGGPAPAPAGNGSGATGAAPVDPPVEVVLDPDRVTWPTIGTPADLAAVGTTAVDFGAGQGRLPVALTTTQPGGVGPAPTLPPTGVHPLGFTGTPTGQPINIVVIGDGNTVQVNLTNPGFSMPTTSPITPFGNEGLYTDEYLDEYDEYLDEFDEFEEFETELDEALDDPFEVPAFEPFTPTPFEPFTPTPFEPFEPATFESAVPDPMTLPEVALSDRPLDGVTPVPIKIPPPRTAIAAGAAAAVGAAAATGGGGRAPFFPFMPMGGGAGGADDANEPKRRPTKPRGRHTLSD